MPNPGAFHGVRLAVLKSFLDEWRQVVEDGNELEFLSKVIHVFHALFPETLAPDAELDEEVIMARLASLNVEDLEDPIFMPPVQQHGQSNTEYEAAKVEYEELKKQYVFRADQISRWFNYRHPSRPTHETRKEPDTLDRLLGKLSGAPSNPCCRKSAFTVWAQAHPEIVQPLIDQRVLELEAQVAAQEKKQGLTTTELLSNVAGKAVESGTSNMLSRYSVQD
ncbi:hypothetical protein VNI00_018808 [Paramarasmius palmivorus]|uniref:Uncharacterized protein n=1 Tax=Paramarasmius palmivorus TaxID=297713 RepID=A0AAW0AU30_9AGAR